MRGRNSYNNRSLDSLGFVRNISPELPPEIKNMIIQSSAKLIYKYHIPVDDPCIEDYIYRVGVLYYQDRDETIIDWPISYITDYLMIQDGTHGSGHIFGNDYEIAREMCNDLKMCINSARK